MAAITYTVKRGDSLWKICSSSEWGPKISGNTVNAKINTLVSLNNIKNPDRIYVGQILTLSGSGSSQSSSSSVQSNKVTINGFGLQSDSTSGRDMYAFWSWTKPNTKEFRVRWEQYKEGHLWDTTSTMTNDECEYTADAIAEYVQVFVLPIAENKLDSEGKDTGVPYWTAEETGKQYRFSENPPLTPDVAPTCEINDLKLTIKMDDIKAKKLDATHIVFQIIKDNSISLHTSQAISIKQVTDDYYTVSYEYTVEHGSSYKVRAKAVKDPVTRITAWGSFVVSGKESGWSDFSNEVGTKPSAPSSITTYRRNKRSDGSISAYLEWASVANATKYIIEYTTVLEDFETAPDNVQTVETTDARTSLEVTDIDSGYDYFFRVKAVNDIGESSPTEIVTIPIGTPPAAPTTWSSASSAFVGDDMELNWTHNPTDGSRQSYAQLSLKINNDNWVSYTFENTTNETTGELTNTETFTYGTAISYKGELHVKMDTTNINLKNAKVQWKVRTAGVTDQFSDTDWSVERTIYIYEKPTLNLSMTSDLAGTGDLITTLTSFPFYIRGTVSLESYDLQRPIGYHLRIISNEFYITADDEGRTKTVNSGDDVYSKYFDTSETLIVEMSANNIDLESGISYTVYCAADMSTGLTVSQYHEFSVSWIDVEYAINADISVNQETYTALISPYCLDSDGNLVENVTLSVYRREYDGTYTRIASGIPNTNTSVTDPHPSLDYARYRLVAKDTSTGAISFYDMAGYPVNGTAILIQWDEEWTTFDVSDENSVEGPPWSGSMLKLPYNIDVTDNRKPETSFVEYAGRKHPVSYYGTQTGETSTWSVSIPKEDKETIYALRRLSLWAGDVYVREPSGMGYWANVAVTFNINHNEVTVPVTLTITRVEGGA